MEQSMTQERGTVAEAADERGVERRGVGEVERAARGGRAAGPSAHRALAVGELQIGERV